ncbi:shikimate kinase AroK [uncultured Ruminobacter sp.]|uniref:shikimate kinase AroK n=1 Tax=uncultured Ruminobacter sp. TaxID=538947 RepID=UPI0025E2845A|nr:shikimate kinase AroK [uncultured Ruminobacter sp.]
MSECQSIFLVGPMGAGKSTIGKILSELTSLPLIDSDTEIEKRTGADISWVFDVEGEEGFRKREEAVIDELTQKKGIILATGGGAVKNAHNRSALSSRGVVVYLKTSVEKQYQRTCRDTRRPLLNNPDPLGTLQRLMAEREPLYTEVADIVVETDQYSARQIAVQIIDKYEAMKEL